MPTTGQSFVRLTAAQLVGAAVRAAGQVVALNPSNADRIAVEAKGTLLDRAAADLSGDYTKTGAVTVALSGTTPKTIDMTDLTGVTDSYAGDTTFASLSQIVVKNLGAGSVNVAPGGSNPAPLGINGTTPSVTVQAGGTLTLHYPTAGTVSGSAKNILLTPAATTVVSVAFGGA